MGCVLAHGQNLPDLLHSIAHITRALTQVQIQWAGTEPGAGGQVALKALSSILAANWGALSIQACA